jgi:hypothetical protein
MWVTRDPWCRVVAELFLASRLPNRCERRGSALARASAKAAIPLSADAVEKVRW